MQKYKIIFILVFLLSCSMFNNKIHKLQNKKNIDDIFNVVFTTLDININELINKDISIKTSRLKPTLGSVVINKYGTSYIFIVFTHCDTYYSDRFSHIILLAFELNKCSIDSSKATIILNNKINNIKDVFCKQS